MRVEALAALEAEGAVAEVGRAEALPEAVTAAGSRDEGRNHCSRCRSRIHCIRCRVRRPGNHCYCVRGTRLCRCHH